MTNAAELDTAQARPFNVATAAVVFDKTLVKRQRLFAALTVIVPTVATGYALWAAVLYGIRPIDVALLLVFYFLTLMGITVGFHRLLAHRSFTADRPVKVAFTVFGTWSGQGPALHWVSNHRRHHVCSDQAGDPHSPNMSGSGAWGRLKGLFHAHIGSMFADEVTNYARFSPDLMRDPDIVWINKHYLSVLASGLILPGIIGVLFTPTLGGFCAAVLWGGLVRMFLVHHAIWSITSIAHTFGVKTFRSRDESRNSLWLALLTGGEGWHNTHHAFPDSAIFATAPWQIDLGGIVIWLLEELGVAHEVGRVNENAARAKSLT
jgi:stearoyl-CoA desaturase (delta-9 desaturase)